MEIAIRRPGSAWVLRPTQPYDGETQLQELLASQPNLIPLHQLGDQVLAPRVAVRELPLRPAGVLDLLAFDEAGGVTLVECKLDANVESKRTVIGQLFEYASALWRMEYDDLDLLVRHRTDTSLADLMEAAVADEDADWSPDDFRTAVGRHLKTGDFRLIVAVDRVNDRLRAIVEYLNQAGPSSMRLHLLDVRYFVSGDTEVLMPQLHGEEPLRSPEKAIRQKTDREAFLAGCDDHGRAFFSPLLAGAGSAGLTIDWGGVGFTIKLNLDGERISALRGYPASSQNGQRLVLLAGKWREQLPAQTAEMLENRLSELPDAPRPFTAKKVVLRPVDARFGPGQVRLILDALSAVMRAVDSGQ